MGVHSFYTRTPLLVYCMLVLTAVAAAPNVRVFSIEGPSKAGQSQGERVTVTVNVRQTLNTISPHFVGVTIDAGQILLNWSTLDFGSKKVQNMARALTPSYFRLGGTYADTMTYDLGDKGDPSDPLTYDLRDRPESSLGEGYEAGKVLAKFNLTAKEWDSVYQFSRTVGWDFIMDLNALKRNPDGSWNPDNARQLLQYSADRNFTIAGFELGNEYDVYQQSFNITVTPKQLARDVGTLTSLLSQFPQYTSAFVIGPETVTKLGIYFEGFLAAGGSQLVKAASFHQYYFAGSQGHVSDFVSVGRMDELKDKVDTVLQLTRFVNPLLPVWLSETSSAYDSGTPNVSDRFVAGFLWLDKLGVCASKGVQSVIRQAFYGGHYSLVNAQLDPNPDFWLTVLFKRIVLGAVFNATATSDVRVYSACANTQYYKPGSVAVYLLNPHPYPVTLNLPQFRGHDLLVYSLTAGDDLGLVSRYTSLNGVRLSLVDDQLPEFRAKTVYGDIPMDAYSFMFVVIQDARVTICLEGP